MKKKSLICLIITVGLLLTSTPYAFADSTIAGWWKVGVYISSGDFVTGDWQLSQTFGARNLSFLYIFLLNSSSGTAYLVENIAGVYSLENTFTVYMKNNIVVLTGPPAVDDAGNLTAGSTIVFRASGVGANLSLMRGYYTRYDTVAEQSVRMGTLTVSRFPVQAVPDAVMQLIPGP